MLDAETKRRIDTARDILVGKVPDPKSQVEQITIALIYKFMDDMDAGSEELGGTRKFFAGEFARFGWPKLMRSGLGGHEMLNLYAEAIDRMPENPGIPPLFRDIFNNAYLPYRDPETLRAFLKIIDEFTYDHSERLGDAFEYLLSVLGSQGDAGQFRTPRHIIDFIVAVLDPKKSETVLDPACGTAGFLISSYKHIMAANTDDKGIVTLTPDERERLTANLQGYDISPDMVRLSLVNMYLHGFPEPHIIEYDTLTSDDRWNEYADVILANPPFMSPKGGIRPHNRFSVKSKRSEVLFVDYMAEHLTPAGRAGIIVPEGIIFQSQNAHKQLRKMLVEEYLVAVVSLPAGVFNPYSGVKTSILILDKALVKRSDRIAFFKVENDGFDLGAQRRPIDKNDLPQTQQAAKEYMDGQDGQDKDEPPPSPDESALEKLIQQGTALIVEKTKIADGGEYNLSGERYRETTRISSAVPFVSIGEICIVNPPKSELTAFPTDTTVSFVPMSDINENQITFVAKQQKILGQVGASYTYFADNDVLVSKVTPCFENGKAGIARNLKNGIGFGSSEFYVIRASEEVLPEWVYYCVTHASFRQAGIDNMTGTGGLQRVPRKFIEDFQIPLPPLEAQQEIVAEIEGYQRVIDGARTVIDNYRPHIPIDPDWPMVEVREICTVNPRRSELASLNGTISVSFVPMADLGTNTMYFASRQFKSLEDVGASYTYFRDNDVLLAKVTPCFENGKAGIANGLRNGIGFGSSEFYVLRPTHIVLAEWIFLCVATATFRKWATPQMTGTGGLQRVPKAVLESYRIPLPSREIQKGIVSEIKSEQALLDSNRTLVNRMEKRIRAAIGRVWGDGRQR